MLLTRYNNQVEITIGSRLYRGVLRHRQGIIGEGYIHFEDGQSVVCRLVLDELSSLCGRDIRNHPLFSGEGLWPYGNVRDQLNFIKMIATSFPSEVQKILTPEEVGRLRVLNKL